MAETVIDILGSWMFDTEVCLGDIPIRYAGGDNISNKSLGAIVQIIINRMISVNALAATGGLRRDPSYEESEVSFARRRRAALYAEAMSVVPETTYFYMRESGFFKRSCAGQSWSPGNFKATISERSG